MEERRLSVVVSPSQCNFSADLLWVSGYSAVNCRVLQKDHPTCSGGLPLLE